MSGDDPFLFWRIAPEVSVNDAAILMVNGDPSDKVTYSESQFFAAFAAVKAAISSGELQARMKYHAENYYGTEFDDVRLVQGKCLLVAAEDIGALLSSPGDARLNRYGTVAVELEPDWTLTTVRMTDLRAWLQSKGVSEGVLFPSGEPASAPITDPAHDHFSPDLALAVTVWRALEADHRTDRSPKSTIVSWIDTHPEAWKGEEPLTRSVKERIVRIVNWRKTGGAPTTGRQPTRPSR